MYNSIKYFPRAITVKAVIEPHLGMVSQLEEGLQLYGFLQEIKKFPDLFKPLFVANSSSMFDVTPDKFLTNVVITYSEKQSTLFEVDRQGGGGNTCSIIRNSRTNNKRHVITFVYEELLIIDNFSF